MNRKGLSKVVGIFLVAVAIVGAFTLVDSAYAKQQNLSPSITDNGWTVTAVDCNTFEENNNVTLSYRKENFARLKPKNLERINEAFEQGKIKPLFNSQVKEILEDKVILNLNDDNEEKEIENDLVFIFAGGVLPTKFLESIGIRITKKFGDAILKHSR